MKIRILTFFPDIFKSYFENVAPFKKAIGSGEIEIEILQIRDFTKDRHRRCDGYPYGGGAGLVLFCQPIMDAINSTENPGRILFMSPDGKKFDQNYAKELSGENVITLVAGRYEGYDNRIFSMIANEKVSVGDYVLTGGECPALIIIDALVRLIPDVLENEKSLEEESFSSGLLEYAQYTRPENYNGFEVPEVYLSGHHGKIREHRFENALINTYETRPDLLKNRALNESELKIIKNHIKENCHGS